MISSIYKIMYSIPFNQHNSILSSISRVKLRWTIFLSRTSRAKNTISVKYFARQAKVNAIFVKYFAHQA